MGKLLYIQASPRGSRSHSAAVAEAFVNSYRQSHPGDQTATLNIFNEALPSFDGLAVQAKYTILHGREHSQAELDVWKHVEALIEQFKSYDKYVLAVPMWNFGIPYRLKQYIDILVQPGYTFSYSPQSGYNGLVTGKGLFVAYARGGDYSAPDHKIFDMQKKYIELIFGFMGFSDIRSVIVQPTLEGGSETAKVKQTDAIEKAKQIAKEF